MTCSNCGRANCESFEGNACWMARALMLDGRVFRLEVRLAEREARIAKLEASKGDHCAACGADWLPDSSINELGDMVEERCAKRLAIIQEQSKRIQELEVIAVAADALRREAILCGNDSLNDYVSDLDRAMEPYWARLKVT